MNDRRLRKLDPKHQQLARLLVGGNSQSQIARLLNLNKSTVSRLLRDPLVLQEVKRLQEFADVNAASCVPGLLEKIREGAQEGAKVLMEILADERADPEILKLKANVSLELLSRVGYGPVKQVEVKQASISGHFTAEDIEKIKKRAQENGMVFDNSYVGKD